MAVVSSAQQASLPGLCPVTDAVALLAAAGIEQRGSIHLSDYARVRREVRERRHEQRQKREKN